MTHPAPLAIGIDIGATKIAAVLVDRAGNVLEMQKIDTRPYEAFEAVVERICRLVNFFIQAAQGDIGGIGIGVPGQVNPESGIVRYAVNLGWDEVALLEAIRPRLVQDLPLWVQKDANANLLGEYYFGSAQGVENCVYLGIGSGLGSAFMINGRLVVGAHWIAGNLGHLSLDPDGLPCKCGLRGCVETILSGPGLLRRMHQSISERQEFRSDLAGQIISPEQIIQSAQQGDALALSAFDNLGRCLGILLAICVVMLDPAVVVIGGGLGKAAFDLLVPPARHELARRRLNIQAQDLEIVPSTVVSSAVGAACQVWYN